MFVARDNGRFLYFLSSVGATCSDMTQCFDELPESRATAEAIAQILTAGNTWQGKAISGEGIMGLTRAFMYAGIPVVGVTLWSVDSKASSEINTRFFRHLKVGKNLANALRQVKLDLLVEAEKDSDLEHFRHPFFWAPFVVFGDGR